MPDNLLQNLFLEQSNDLIWMVDSNLGLIYANQSYLNLMKQVTGEEKKLNEPVLVEGFGEGYIEKWSGYYNKALSGEYLELEEHYSHPESGEIHYGQIIFNPIRDDKQQVIAVACQSRDITRIVRQRSEAHQLMDASLDVFCTINEAGNFVFVSEAATKHWGFTPNELLGVPYTSLILEEDIPKTNAIVDAILSGEEIKSFVNRYKRKDGAIAYNQWSARWDYDARLMYCVARDSKDKIEQEEKLLQSEQRFKDLVQEGADLIAILDADGTYRYVSPTSFSILGMQPEEFLGRSPFEFIHPEDADRTMASLQKITEQHKVQVEPFRFKNNKNEWRWIETVLTNMLNNPAVNGIVANSRDITDTVNLLNELEANEQFNKTVIESSPDCLKILDNEGQLVYMNFNGLCQMEIDDFSEFKNKKWWQLWGAENEALVKESVYKALRGEIVHFSAFCPTAKGTPKWWDVMVSPVSKPGEPIQKIISISRDVTEQKVKEREKELFTNISLNFSRENDFSNACIGLCQTVGVFGQFDWVELWTLNIERSKIQYSAHYMHDPSHKFFYDETRGLDSFEIGHGLPGHVWLHKNQVLWNTLDDTKDFVRKKAAEKISIKTVLGLPLLNQDEVIGVLLVGSKQGIESLEKYAGLFANFHRFIGSEINRKKLENDLSHLYDAIPDIICITDLQGKFLKINRAFSEMIGYDHDEILHATYEKFVHPGDKLISQNDLENLKKGIKTNQFENRYLTKTGQVMWLSWTSNAALEEGLIYATAKNITEEKRLRELNRTASKLARIGSWEVDMQTNKIFWSEMVHQLHETDPENFEPELGQGIDFYREDFRTIVTEAVNQCIKSAIPFDFEAVIVTVNKNELWVRAIGNAEFMDGKCVRIYGSFQDIHDRKEAELRLQSLANNLPGVVFQYLIYPDGTDALKNVTKGATEIWEYSPEAVMENIDLVWDQTRAGGDFEEVSQNIKESVKTKTKWISRYKSVAPSGKIRTLLGTGTPDFLADGTVLYNSVVLDITQEAKNEELLKQASDMAKIGSWELDLVHQEFDAMYWSPMTRAILEVDEQYNSSIMGSFEFYTEDSKQRIQQAVDALIETGKEFDEELLIITTSKKEKWIRCIGKSERVKDKCVKIFGSFQDIHETKALEIQIREILESISDYFYALDADLNFTYINSSCATLLAVTKEKIIGKNLFAEFPDLKNTLFEDELRKVQKTGEATKFEFYYAPFDAWFEESIYPTPAGISLYFVDISERKKADVEIAKSEEKRRLIMNGALDAIISIDTNERITFWNSQAEVIFGWKAEEVLGEALSELIIPEPFRKYHVEGLRNYLQTGEGRALNVLLELAAIRRNGEEFPIELTVIPIKQGGEEFFCAFIRDITQRKKTERELLNAFEEKNSILERITEAFVALDSNWCYTHMNKKAGEIFNRDPEKMIGKHIWTEFPEGLNQPFHLAYEKAMETQQYIHVEEYYPPYDLWFENHIYPSPEGLSIFFRDVSERKRHESELLELNETLKKHAHELELTNEQLEQFAFIASHDLQEPLRMISSFLDQLKRKYGGQLDEKAHQYIHFATDGAKRMKQIILDLLEYSRAGKQQENRVKINFDQLIGDYKSLRKKIIHEKPVVIDHSPLPVIDGYRAPFTQVIHCLLDNAIKYSRDGIAPRIELGVQETGSEWMFSVRDNGLGIAPEFFDKIFIIFQRLHNRTKYDGSGIGLSIVKKQVESWGGKVWLESTVGEGTAFYFTVPKN